MKIRTLLTSGLLWGFSLAAVADTVGVGTMSQGTISFTTGSVIAKVMNEKMGLQARVQPNSGETVLVPLVSRGEIQFGIANVLETQEAVNGLGAFSGRPQPNLQVAAALFPLRTALFVRADSPYQSIADLKGQRITVGFSAMGSVDRVVKALLASGGLRDGDYRPVLVPNVVAAADQLANGRADAFFFAVGGAKVAEVNASIPLRALPMPTDEASVARAKAIFSGGYPILVRAGQNLAGVTSDISVMGYDNMLLTSATISPELVKKVLSGIVANRDSLIEAFPLFRGLDPKQMVKTELPVTYHPASIEWARSQR
ncbi:MAG: TAXI family TRAP transporter solute-binding subunit [Burkholderiaceae bacterium]